MVVSTVLKDLSIYSLLIYVIIFCPWFMLRTCQANNIYNSSQI